MKQYWIIFLFFNFCYAQESWKITTAELKPFVLETNLQKEIKEKLLNNSQELLGDLQSDDHPLYGLNECIERDCTLSRLKNPNVRALFSEKVVNELSKKHQGSATKERTIAFLGSGSLFAEAEIIMRIALKGCKDLTFVLIDYEYQSDIAVINEQQKKGIPLEKIAPALKTKAILSFLKLMSHLSDNNFTFVFYSSLPDYVRDAQKTSHLSPSTVLAIDPFQNNVKEEIANSLVLLNSSLIPGGMSYILQRGASHDLRVQATMVISSMPKELNERIKHLREFLQKILLCSQQSSQSRSLSDCLKEARKTMEGYEKAREEFTHFLQPQKTDIRRTIGRK